MTMSSMISAQRLRDQEGFLGEVALEASETSCVGVRKLKVGGGKGRQKEQHRQRREASTAVGLERPGGWEVRLGFYPSGGSPWQVVSGDIINLHFKKNTPPYFIELHLIPALFPAGLRLGREFHLSVEPWGMFSGCEPSALGTVGSTSG